MTFDDLRKKVEIIPYSKESIVNLAFLLIWMNDAGEFSGGKRETTDEKRAKTLREVFSAAEEQGQWESHLASSLL